MFTKGDKHLIMCHEDPILSDVLVAIMGPPKFWSLCFGL